FLSSAPVKLAGMVMRSAAPMVGALLGFPQSIGDRESCPQGSKAAHGARWVLLHPPALRRGLGTFRRAFRLCRTLRPAHRACEPGRQDRFHYLLFRLAGRSSLPGAPFDTG